MLNGGSLSRVAGENVGVYGINQGGLGLVSANYDLSYQGNNLTITKALLNVIADAKTKVYGDADPALTYQVSGLKNGDPTENACIWAEAESVQLGLEALATWIRSAQGFLTPLTSLEPEHQQ